MKNWQRVRFMILGKQLCNPRNTEPKRHAGAWNRLNPKDMKRTHWQLCFSLSGLQVGLALFLGLAVVVALNFCAVGCRAAPARRALRFRSIFVATNLEPWFNCQPKSEFHQVF